MSGYRSRPAARRRSSTWPPLLKTHTCTTLCSRPVAYAMDTLTSPLGCGELRGGGGGKGSGKGEALAEGRARIEGWRVEGCSRDSAWQAWTAACSVVWWAGSVVAGGMPQAAAFPRPPRLVPRGGRTLAACVWYTCSASTRMYSTYLGSSMAVAWQ